MAKKARRKMLLQVFLNKKEKLGMQAMEAISYILSDVPGSFNFDGAFVFKHSRHKTLSDAGKTVDRIVEALKDLRFRRNKKASEKTNCLSFIKDIYQVDVYFYVDENGNIVVDVYGDESQYVNVVVYE